MEFWQFRNKFVRNLRTTAFILEVVFSQRKHDGNIRFFQFKI